MAEAATDTFEAPQSQSFASLASHHNAHTYTFQLEQHVEARLLALSPPQVQAQVARLRAPAPTPDEVLEIERGLAVWEAEAQAKDRGWLDKAQKTAGAEAKGRCVCGGGGWVVLDGTQGGS